VRGGTLFVALRGAHVDGHAFAPAAVAAGAAAVVVENELALDVPQIVVPDTRAAISRLADAFFERPSQTLRIAGVTGTNGKTTTVHLIAAIVGAAGSPCAVIGTLGAAFGDRRWPLGNTTPLALELQALLAELRAAGAAAVAMEVSSHALALGRVDDVRFAVAAFTNLTRDHLDFHGSLTEYANAKRRLLGMAPQAVINLDDPVGAAFAREFPQAATYAIDAPAQIRAQGVRLAADGSSFRVDGSAVELPLRGRFNVYNALAAFGVARSLGIPDATIVRALARVDAVPGRMERIAELGIDAIVDYAHTPDALENVLRAARESTRGRVIVVFGCGGDRDPGKRAPMGEIAARLADRAIVTSDNPRSEDPAAIARAIAAGGPGEIVLDRRGAIRAAIAAAAAGDTVVVAGKGHETYQIVGDRVLPFDDREEVRAAFAARREAQAVR
jgi:UDP-N-acetylmuramoyl-L-alanyl-D-glutamate--2,6-diaminopimelate ligase